MLDRNHPARSSTEPDPGEQPVSQIIPKLFTGSSVKKLCSTKPSHLHRGGHGLSRSLIEQSQRGSLKRFAESTAGIIPGDRGKVGGSWCHPPLRIRVSGLAAGKSHQFLWSESCPAGFHESGAERLGAIRNRVRAESGPQEVSTCVPTYVTQRVMVATTNDQNAVTFPGGVHTCQKAPSLPDGARNGNGTARSERAWQSPSTSSMGRREKTRHPAAKANAT